MLLPLSVPPSDIMWSVGERHDLNLAGREAGRTDVRLQRLQRETQREAWPSELHEASQETFSEY